MLTWTMFLDAPIDVETAHKLQAAGRLLMANRHTGERVESVVRQADRRRPTGTPSDHATAPRSLISVSVAAQAAPGRRGQG